MGLTKIKVEVGNPSKPDRTETINLLVDSGALCSMVPAPVLKRLGIKPLMEQEFCLANGDIITRKKGGALFKYKGRVGVSDVIFGEEGDYNLLGVLTLESLGFALDPFKRELIPMPMILALYSSGKEGSI